MSIGTRQRCLFAVSSLAFAVVAGNAAAGGFEKATMWDAKYTALGGAAVSSVNTSSAIFYNPAGLARIESNDIALHASPTVTQTNGPAAGDDTYMKGEKNFVPNAGLTGAYRFNEKFVLGYGVYGAGGAASSYKDVTVGTNYGFLMDYRQTGEYSTDIKIIEAGLALAYQIDENWSIGGTYRLTYAQADINMMSSSDIALLPPFPGNVGAAVGYNDMSGLNAFGVRLGAMYRSDDNRWGWGINYRSDVSIEADGTASFNNGANLGAYEGRSATAETALPTQISTGFDYKVALDWTVFTEVTYTKYSSINKIRFVSDEQNLKVKQINTNWNDQWNFRFATEYTGIENWALRAGYIYTTAVTPEEYASPAFSTPAGAHTLTMGAGTTFMDGKLAFDMAAEYNYAKNSNVKGGGDLTGTPEEEGSRAYSGKYDTNAWAVHASLRYMF